MILDGIEKHHIKLIGKEETCLPVIKIKELPKKQYSEMAPTDIMVIEDSSDTKQITVEQLQLFFSSDEKLQAIIDQMEKEFAEIRKYIEDHLKNVINKDEELEARLNNLFEDHERTKQQVGRIQEDLVDAQNDIIEIKSTAIGTTVLSDVNMFTIIVDTAGLDRIIPIIKSSPMPTMVAVL